jgi:hypothetical protein
MVAGKAIYVSDVPDNSFVTEFRRQAMLMPRGAPSVGAGHNELGHLVDLVPGRGIVLKNITTRQLDALLRENRYAERWIHSKSPRWHHDRAVEWINKRRVYNAITGWDNVLANRTGGKAMDYIVQKSSQTTVANAWSFFFRSGGVPAAGSYTAITGGSAPDSSSTGAIPFADPSGSDVGVFLNMAWNHTTGTNVVWLVDLLVGAGNISTTTTSPQTVNSTALTRYTDGAGVYGSFDVVAALGGTASNITVTYTNQAGTGSRSSGAVAMTTSAIAFRLQPTANEWSFPLQSGDLGVKSVETVTFSASMTGTGTLGLILFKPLMFYSTFATTSVIERSPVSMMAGSLTLGETAGGKLGCYTFMTRTSTTSTGLQTYQWFGVYG